MYKLPEFIPEDLSPGELDGLTTALSNEVARLARLVGTYAINMKTKEKVYKKKLSAAIVLNKDKGTPSIVKCIAEQTRDVLDAEDEHQQAEALYIMGKAELDGREAQYQGAKKLVELKVQELRSFKG
ncbi:hypothetical protein [Anaerospora hongkongensis]|uniref:hypothetical protein n=1 Tax=Anaerospora hongkongensis TaxID=244830 RepID=UPI002FDB3664